jgi:hypothetical protein
MYIIIFENSDNTRRAFIKTTEKKANNFVEEMEQNGWDFCSMDKIDCLMHDTLKISINN